MLILAQIPSPTLDVEDSQLLASVVSGPALSENFSVTLEFQILSLPPKGQLMAMLRFSLPDLSQVIFVDL